MKKILSILILALFVMNGVSAQESSEDKSKKELRQERKEQREQESKAVEDSIRVALEEGDFTLRANTIQNRIGRIINVDNAVNFVAIKGDEVAVQLGNLLPVGYNGVGGITYKGKIQDMEIHENKNGSGFYARMIFNSPNTINSASVRIDVFGDSVSARFINGINKWTMRGFFERTSESLIFLSQNRTIGLIF